MCPTRRSGDIGAVEFRDRFISVYGHAGEVAERLFVDMAMLVPDPERRRQLLSLSPDVRCHAAYVPAAACYQVGSSP